MKIPNYLQQNSNIGVTAPSGGVEKTVDIVRFNNGAKKLKEQSYNVSFTNDVFKSDGKGRSADGKTRALEFMSLIEDKAIDYIVSAKGGDFLAEMLPYLNYDIIKENPKWVQGYSDNTSILLSITTKCDIATVYGSNFGNYGMDIWHTSVKNNIEILKGNLKVQKSFERYENGFFDKETGFEGFRLTDNVELKNGYGRDEECFEGRLLGGCLDVLCDIAGTRYEDVTGFVKRYEKDKVLWFIESFDAVSERIIIQLWKLKELGWFDNAAGFIFGRPAFFKSYSETSYEEAVMTALKELNVPVIFGCDVGHKEPQWTIINGIKARMRYKAGRGSLEYLE